MNFSPLLRSCSPGILRCECSQYEVSRSQFDNACEGCRPRCPESRTHVRSLSLLNPCHVMSCTRKKKKKQESRKEEGEALPFILARPAFRFVHTFPIHPLLPALALYYYCNSPPRRLRLGYIIASDLILIDSKILRVSKPSHVERRFDSNGYTGVRGEKPSCRAATPLKIEKSLQYTTSYL